MVCQRVDGRYGAMGTIVADEWKNVAAAGAPFRTHESYIDHTPPFLMTLKAIW
jgi:hypothetical protein